MENIRYPVSTQWITFPTRPTENVEISWVESNVTKSNIYYHCKCWWGELSRATGEQWETGKPRAVHEIDLDIQGM